MSLFLLMAAFVFTGLNSISNRALHPMGLDDYKGLYCLGFWGMGVLLGLALRAVTRHEVRKDDAPLGIAMGAAGAAAMVLLLMSLKSISGIVAFPVRSCGNTTLTAVVSYFLWREHVTLRQWIGIACGILAIYLLLPAK